MTKTRYNKIMRLCAKAKDVQGMIYQNQKNGQFNNQALTARFDELMAQIVALSD